LKKMERVRRSSSHREVEVRSTGGKLYFGWITAARASPNGPRPWQYRRFDDVVDMPPLGAPSHAYLGIGYGQTTWNTREEERTLVIADWTAAICFLILPTWWVVLEIRRRRPSPGHCAVCGYDLRATPDRCPECGTAAVTKREPVAPRPPAR
jgi:hypothetical protein